MAGSAVPPGGNHRESPDSPSGVSTGIDMAVECDGDRAVDDRAPIESWDELFRFIRQSLGETDDWSPPLWAGTPSRAPYSTISPALFRCVAELHRLHPTVMQQLRRHERIEQLVLDAYAGLESVRGELTGTGRKT